MSYVPIVKLVVDIQHIDFRLQLTGFRLRLTTLDCLLVYGRSTSGKRLWMAVYPPRMEPSVRTRLVPRPCLSSAGGGTVDDEADNTAGVQQHRSSHSCNTGGGDSISLRYVGRPLIVYSANYSILVNRDGLVM